MSVQKDKKKATRNILVITDFTKSSSNAILFAAHLFKNADLSFNLLNVYDNPGVKATLLISVEDILAKDSEAGLQRQSAEVASALKKLKPVISTHSVTGKLKKAISIIAQSEQIDLIVAGIPSNKYPCKNLKDRPLLFMGQSRVPVLLVPENCSDKPIKNILILNLDGHHHKTSADKGFECIINHDHISKFTISLNEKKIDSDALSLFYGTLKENNANLIIIIPAVGDNMDRLLLDYQIQELCPAVSTLLNC